MTPEEEERDRLEGFFKILFLGQLLTPSCMEVQKKQIGEILQESGLMINSSDFQILDHSRIGNSAITIANFTLDYIQDGEVMKKRVCRTGTVTLRIDDSGNTTIKVFSMADPCIPDRETALQAVPDEQQT
ncbi:MAG: hypothetical protein A4E35_02398 [Methanoregula sp. PtaU1.Bin051]|nr:MAG: hypothetical protein A4E35_02398 [Methanoregula sp. PtaU1.Bin051]